MIDLFFNLVTFNGYLETWLNALCFWILALIFFHIPIKIYLHFIKKKKEKNHDNL